jgi:tRNA-dihydrouridine synthase A
MITLDRKISVAPMMDCTDRHYRYFARLLSQHTVLYSEMVTAAAIKYGDRDHLLHFSTDEQPVALQLGGSNPKDLALAAKIGEDYGYAEINLNVGCPSDRVQAGRFGACLMKEPRLVADCMVAMQQAVSVPVTVKTRLGVDEFDSYEWLCRFIDAMVAVDCYTLILHARKAWLKGLSPKENRDVPPLQYEKVYQVKQDYPQLEILLNGGVKTLDEVQAHLQHIDGVMIGREAYSNPYILAEMDQRFYGAQQPVITQVEVIKAYLPYIEAQQHLGVPVRSLIRFLVGMFKGQPRSRLWRRCLSEPLQPDECGMSRVVRALETLHSP